MDHVEFYGDTWEQKQHGRMDLLTSAFFNARYCMFVQEVTGVEMKGCLSLASFGIFIVMKEILVTEMRGFMHTVTNV